MRVDPGVGLPTEQLGVVELGLVHEHVRVRVRRDREVALADVLADPRPGNTAPDEADECAGGEGRAG